MNSEKIKGRSGIITFVLTKIKEPLSINNFMLMKTKRYYSKEFKLQAISIAEVAKKLGTGLPKATQVVLKLIEEGISIDTIPLNSREAAPILKQILRGGRT